MTSEYYVLKVLDQTHNVQTRSNANTAHVANASADLPSFNHVCVCLCVRVIANVGDTVFA